MRYLLLLSIALFAVLLAISACGKKGDPIPPKPFNEAPLSLPPPLKGDG